MIQGYLIVTCTEMERNALICTQPGKTMEQTLPSQYTSIAEVLAPAPSIKPPLAGKVWKASGTSTFIARRFEVTNWEVLSQLYWEMVRLHLEYWTQS